MTKGRFFRALICFLVIFCLFCNYAALPSRAFAFAEVAIPAMALILMYLIMQTGFIPPPDITISNLENVDNAFRNWYGDFDITFRNPDDPWPDDLDDEESDLSDQLDAIKDAINNGAEADLKQTLKISEELMNAFRLYIAFCIGENAIPLLGEAAPEGYAYYNGVRLPILPTYDSSTYPFLTVLYRADELDYLLIASDVGLTYRYSTAFKTYNFYGAGEGNKVIFSFDSSQDSWSSLGTGYVGFSSGYPCDTHTWVYSNYNILYREDDSISGSVSFASCGDPLTQEEAYLEAVAILGETAQGIQDGTKTEDDIVIPQYVNVSELFANAASADDMMQNYNQIAQELQDGTRDYNDFAQSVVAANPSTGDNVNDNTGSDSEIGDSSGTDSGDSWEPPQDPGKFALDLKQYFPFCIPFDLYAFLACLNADPVTPVIQWELALPGGGSYPIEIDLSPFDSVAQLLRRLQLLLFIIGLAIKTRDLIKG